MIIVVELIESIPPRNTLSMMPQPSSCPTPKPMSSIPPTSVNAVIIAVPPTCASLWRLNSRPRPNMSTITPISLQVLMDALSATVKKNGIYGPMRKPATM